MQFRQLFQSYVVKIRQLCAFLDDEYQALRNDDQARLIEITEKKQTLLQHCQDDEAQLVTLIHNITGCQDQRKWGDYISTLPEIFGHEIEPLRRELLNSAAQCKKQNQINGTVIAARINNLRKVLDIFRYGNEKQAVGYNAQGKLISQIKDLA